MNRFNAISISLLVSVLLAGCVANSSVTPSGHYAGQHARAIKALSSDDIRSLREGRGMGFAKAAELNGYPGPMHVLEHSEALALSTEQVTATRNLLDAHKAEARELGEALVDSEATLDVLFATRTIDGTLLERQLAVIASRQAAVRASHLRTHLLQTALLSRAQIEKYAELRGYKSDSRHEAHAQH